MASATGIPESPSFERREEDEPLLGRPGDASQRDGRGIQYNFIIGTAVIAQAGIWILTAIVWAAVFSDTKNLILFSAHPLLNSAGILLSTQAILILQPTHTPPQKAQGALIHAILNSTAALTLLAGLIIIEYNKFAHAGPHFASTHAYLGVITYLILFVQVVVGVTMYYVPSVYGGVDGAKAVWKYHRMSGYVLLGLFLGTVAAATRTGYVVTTLGIRLWAVLVASGVVVVGVVPRIRKRKFGF